MSTARTLVTSIVASALVATPALAAKQKPKKSVRVVKLSPLGNKDIKVKPGTRLTWSYESHGSVGKTGSCSIGNKTSVKLVDRTTKYKYPDKIKKGMKGADRGTGTYVFEAVAPGKARITCSTGFRGKTQRTDEYTVTVTGKKPVVGLVPFKKDYAVPVGTHLVWSYESHGSVGKGGSCTGSPKSRVRIVEKKVTFKNPGRVKKGMTGADAGTGKVVFETFKPGKATLTCFVEFRGKTTRTDTFEVKVLRPGEKPPAKPAPKKAEPAKPQPKKDK